MITKSSCEGHLLTRQEVTWLKEKKDTKELLNELEQEMVRVEKEKVDLRNDKELHCLFGAPLREH